jgi:integrase
MRGDGFIYQRGDTWWICYPHNGRRVRESSKGFVYKANGVPSDGRDRKAAEKLLQLRRRTAGTPYFIGPKAERLGFEDLATRYLTDYTVNRRRSLSHAQRHVRTLRGTFGLDRALDITAERIVAYAVARLADGLKPAAVNRELAALRRMFKLAVRSKVLPHAPYVAMLDESENVREGFVEPAEFEAVCAHLPTDVQDAARFAYTMCWRIGAVRALEWRDVDLKAGTLQLRASSAKNKRAKTLPLTGDVLALLERRSADRDLAVPFVFTHQGRRLGRFRKSWQHAATAAGLGGLVFHDLRRSAARNAIRAGVPERVVMDLGGWKTRSVFDRYNVTSEQDLADALDRTSRYLAERSVQAPKVRPLRTSTATEQPQSVRSRRPATAKAGLTR